VGWEKVASWSTKAAIYLKHVKTEETLGYYRNSTTHFRTVPSPTSYDLVFLKIGVCNPHPKLQSLLSQEREKLRTSNLAAWYILAVHPNKSPLKILKKRERGRIQVLPIFRVPPIISGAGKATNFNFNRHIHRIDRNKSPL